MQGSELRVRGSVAGLGYLEALILWSVGCSL